MIKEGEIYTNNKSGYPYEVLLIANSEAYVERRDKFPLTVVYKKLMDGSVWCREAGEFREKFTRVD